MDGDDGVTSVPPCVMPIKLDVENSSTYALRWRSRGVAWSRVGSRGIAWGSRGVTWWSPLDGA
eukprot:6794633-Prymnesium_polylepis.1